MKNNFFWSANEPHFVFSDPLISPHHPTPHSPHPHPSLWQPFCRVRPTYPCTLLLFSCIALYSCRPLSSPLPPSPTPTQFHRKRERERERERGTCDIIECVKNSIVMNEKVHRLQKRATPPPPNFLPPPPPIHAAQRRAHNPLLSRPCLHCRSFISGPRYAFIASTEAWPQHGLLQLVTCTPFSQSHQPQPQPQPTKPGQGQGILRRTQHTTEKDADRAGTCVANVSGDVRSAAAFQPPRPQEPKGAPVRTHTPHPPHTPIHPPQNQTGFSSPAAWARSAQS